MTEQIFKLSPNRDLQCYFLQPSAIAAMSHASDTGFVVSGKWRQQFDWAVVEWNRDNVFEHPVLRNLPDGDLSGLTLSYQEQRNGCIPIESNLFPDVAWNKIRVWVPNGDQPDTIYYIDVAMYAQANGPYAPASATMTLTGSPGAGNRVGLAWLDEHYYYMVADENNLAAIANGLAAVINDPNVGSPTFSASSDGVASITVTWAPKSSSAPYQNFLGANGNRLGMYGFSQGNTQVWQQPSAMFSGGQFPGTNGASGSYQISLDFSNVQGTLDPNLDPRDPANAQYVVQVPMNDVRKVRWTWMVDLQSPAELLANGGAFQQSEFQVSISNWTVTGSNRIYSVAGFGSRRIEDTDPSVFYSGSWTSTTGNYSGSKIHSTIQGSGASAQGASCTITYSEAASHQLFAGTRLLSNGATVAVMVDGQPLPSLQLQLNGEDVLVRSPLGTWSAGTHTVTFTQTSADPMQFWFDFLEIVYPSTNLPDFESQTQLALATDWDTYHSQALPAERTAWLIQKLGFTGRVNHYTGALWFYEIVRTGTQYASATVTLAVPTPTGSSIAQLQIDQTVFEHLILFDETPESLAQAFALLINNGTNSVWASATGSALTITARAMGIAGNGLMASVTTNSTGFSMSPSPSTLGGGIDGTSFNLDTNDPLQGTLMAATDHWCTDLTATPRMNRAARDWHLAYFTALKGYGIDAVASFSMELGNGDPADEVGIAQRYLDGTPVVLNTPSVQTNFSPTSLAYWMQVYLEMAGIQTTAGLAPYLQFGEVQWWYTPKQMWDLSTQQYVDANIGMPFYDDYTKQQFLATYGVNMQTILENTVSPSDYPNETIFLPMLIGAYTASIRTALQNQFAGCRCEVLYPTDTNNTSLNKVVNYPASDWTPANLNCLKTESFQFTSAYNLDLSQNSMNTSAAKGFLNSQRSHLVGISDAWTSWMKEVDLAQSQGLESVVLFALDQYCLIGYSAPPFVKLVRSQWQG